MTRLLIVTTEALLNKPGEMDKLLRWFARTDRADNAYEVEYAVPSYGLIEPLQVFEPDIIVLYMGVDNHEYEFEVRNSLIEIAHHLQTPPYATYQIRRLQA